MCLQTYPTCGNSENVMQKCTFFQLVQNNPIQNNGIVGRTFEICSFLKALLCSLGTCALLIIICALATLLGRLHVLLPVGNSIIRYHMFLASIRTFS